MIRSLRSDPMKNSQRPYQWAFQEPKLEVPTIYKAYVRPKFQEIPEIMALYGTVPPF